MAAFKTFTFKCRKVGALGLFHLRVPITAESLEDAWREWDRRCLSNVYERAGVIVVNVTTHDGPNR
jgi:hypothetical protein